MMGRRLLVAVLSLLALSQSVSATGTLDRLKAVSQHARERAGGVPEHLWVGVVLGVLVLVLIAGAAYWTISKPWACLRMRCCIRWSQASNPWHGHPARVAENRANGMLTIRANPHRPARRGRV